MRRGYAILLGLLAAARAAFALGPHEVVLLVNRHSETSMEVANRYAELRRIPPVNILQLDVPEGALTEAAEISWEEFQQTIGEPVAAELRKRGIADHILAWVYAPDFPVRIATEPALSLQGATFLRGQRPEPEPLRKGEYRSPLFAGPDRPGGPFAESQSLETFAAALGPKMPAPAMMLGVAGARGMTRGQILDHLKAARAADGSGGKAPVWLATNGDVRAQARAWQFPAAVEELRKLGVPADWGVQPPAGRAEMGGLMLGQRNVDPARYGLLAPGALADHLTSFAAGFSQPDQTKLTAWLAHGAAAAAGTVTEPFAIWTKFPNARLFAHAASGCTVLESYAQAVRCPLQLLVVGDPLCAPAAQPIPIALSLLSEGEQAPVSNLLPFVASPLVPGAAELASYLFLLDGRTVPTTSQSGGSLDTRTLPDGWHELRAVAYRSGRVRHQSFAARGFEVRNRGRSVRLRVVGDPERVDLDHPLHVEVIPEGDPVEVALVAQERVVARAEASGPAKLQVNPRALGAGPHRLQGVAVYADRMAVRSEPVALSVQRLNQPPSIRAFAWSDEADAGGVLGIDADDAEGDSAMAIWGQELGHDRESRDGFQVADPLVRAEWKGDAFHMQATSNLVPCRVAGAASTNSHRWSVRLRIPDMPNEHSQPAAGLAFNIRDPRTFDGFGWFGSPSSWAFVRVVDGKATRVVTRGAPSAPGTWVDLAVYRSPTGGLEAEVAGAPLCRWPEGAWNGADAGVFAGPEEAAFRRLAVFPPVRTDVVPTTKGLHMKKATDLGNLFLRLSDGRAARETPARFPAQ